jgi:phospholipase C
VLLLAPGSPQPCAASVTASREHVSLHKLKEARRKIRHVVVIMRENRSSDAYFGTYRMPTEAPTAGA